MHKYTSWSSYSLCYKDIGKTKNLYQMSMDTDYHMVHVAFPKGWSENGRVSEREGGCHVFAERGTPVWEEKNTYLLGILKPIRLIVILVQFKWQNDKPLWNNIFISKKIKEKKLQC